MLVGCEPLESFTDQVWAPTAWTAPLAYPIVSDGYRLIRLVERYWRTPDGDKVVLDAWQKALIIAVLERYPDDWHDERLRGRLRYRQVVISMGRQNGKSLLGGIFALYGLLQHVRGPSVVGIATSVEQANVVYDRVKFAVTEAAPLHKRLKPTGTRGIRHRNGSGGYQVKPALEEGLQSVPITLGLADELHLSKESMWDSIVNGQRAQKDGLIVGITTAGDDKSTLLKRLYKQGMKAITDDASRFGFFLWEAAEGSTIEDPHAIMAANPSVACGRIPIETVYSDVKDLPEHDQERYTLNRFVASLNSWLPLALWRGLDTGPLPERCQPVFTVARAENWTYATITASAKVEGRIYTEVVCSLVNPNIDQLEDICATLYARHNPMKFFMEATTLKDLATRLRERGIPTEYLTQSQVVNACATTYSLISERKVVHAKDPVVTAQVPRGVAKNIGDGWRVSAKDSVGEVDALLATILGVYAAEVTKPVAPSLVVV